ncbi:1-hydroxycarotenoid 3,4-desaturase CrtD [Rhodoferax sp.]|uniref:1-hydroxycarotenoid 3,4-desaturase CrtD n=1 Tax=Rhodoferax sp. TaxID=50421 RepID=UPI003784BA62
MAEAPPHSLRGASVRQGHGPSTRHRVVVVGAGIGGLVSALVLAHRGLDVTVVEAADVPGGKMRQIMVDGAGIDSGPTVFTMRWVFDQMLNPMGTSLDELLVLEPIHVLARHAWRGTPGHLDIFADAQRSADAIAAFSGPQEARRFLGFCQQTRALYQTLEGPYIRSQRPSLWSMVQDLGPRGLGVLAGLGPFASLWGALARHFHDPRLQQLFGRYATYCGASPWSAPATLMLVAQVEQDGVWSVQGGMHAVALALAKFAASQGVQFRYGTACQEIVVQDGQARGVLLANGERLEAPSVVFNGDCNALATGLLGSHAQVATDPVPRSKRSLSALTWSMRARASGFPLVRHNVFFDGDYASEFDDIFQRRRLPQRGTVYVCAQDRNDDATDPGGPERLLCLVNAPADGDTHPFDASETQPCHNRSLALLQQCGLTLQAQPHQVALTTPRQFHQLFPATGGALYGQATHGWMAAFQRPGSRSKLPGLYLTGGSVHPGPGVPMAAMSGRLAAETLMANLDSTSPSRRVVISGGMSTH